MATYNFSLPVTNEDIEKLHVGDTVYLTGKVYTARDMAHLEIKELLEKNEPLPVDFEGSAVFHAGPVLVKDDGNWKLSVIGPTTSFRMEPYADMVGKLGIKMIIGKGGMREDSLKAYKKYKQVYLQAPPGCAVLLGARVTNVSGGTWFEKRGMPEALWILTCDKIGPFAVTMDSHGKSVYDDIKETATKIKDIL